MSWHFRGEMSFSLSKEKVHLFRNWPLKPFALYHNKKRLKMNEQLDIKLFIIMPIIIFNIIAIVSKLHLPALWRWFIRLQYVRLQRKLWIARHKISMANSRCHGIMRGCDKSSWCNCCESQRLGFSHAVFLMHYIFIFRQKLSMVACHVGLSI